INSTSAAARAMPCVTVPPRSPSMMDFARTEFNGPGRAVCVDAVTNGGMKRRTGAEAPVLVMTGEQAAAARAGSRVQWRLKPDAESEPERPAAVRRADPLRVG